MLQRDPEPRSFVSTDRLQIYIIEGSHDQKMKEWVTVPWYEYLMIEVLITKAEQPKCNN